MGEPTLSAAVWSYFESLYGFNDRIERGDRELREGKGVPFRELKRAEVACKHGTFRCEACGRIVVERS